MRLQIPESPLFIGEVPERERPTAPPCLFPEHFRGISSALAHTFQFPFGELDEDSRYEPAHLRGHVNVFGDGDDLLAVNFAELVVEVGEIQVVAEPPVEFIQY